MIGQARWNQANALILLWDPSLRALGPPFVIRDQEPVILDHSLR